METKKQNIQIETEKVLPLKTRQAEILEKDLMQLEEVLGGEKTKESLNRLKTKYLELLTEFIKYLNPEEQLKETDPNNSEFLSFGKSHKIIKESYDKISKELKEYSSILGLEVFLEALADNKITANEAEMLKQLYPSSYEEARPAMYESISNALYALDATKYTYIPQMLAHRAIDIYVDQIFLHSLKKPDEESPQLLAELDLIESSFGIKHKKILYEKMHQKLTEAINSGEINPSSLKNPKTEELKNFFQKITLENLKTEIKNLEKLINDASGKIIYFNQEKGLVMIYKKQDTELILIETIPARGGPNQEEMEKQPELKEEGYMSTPPGHYWRFNSSEHVSTLYPYTWIPYGSRLRIVEKETGKELNPKEKELLGKMYIRKLILNELNRLKEEENTEDIQGLAEQLKFLQTKLIKLNNEIIASPLETETKIRLQKLAENMKKIQVEYSSPTIKEGAWQAATGENATFFTLDKQSFQPNKTKKTDLARQYLAPTLKKNPELSGDILTIDEFLDENGNFSETWIKHDFGPRVIRFISPKGEIKGTFIHSEAGRDYDVQQLEFSHGCLHIHKSDVENIHKETQNGSLIIIANTTEDGDNYLNDIHAGKFPQDFDVNHLKKYGKIPNTKPSRVTNR